MTVALFEPLTIRGVTFRYLAEGRADAVLLGRELTRDPHFALRAAHELGAEIDYVPLSFCAASWE